MSKKLENGNTDAPRNARFIEPLADEPMVLDEDLDMGEDFELDEEGNFSDLTDEEEVPESDTGEEEDESEQDDKQDEAEDDVGEEAEIAQPAKPVKGKHPKSSAEIKLVNLIKENKAMQQKMQEYERQLQAKQTAQQTETLTASFVSQGYDEDTAKKMANDEMRFKQLEERQAILDFREDNADVFAQYPEARKNAADIMRRAKAAELSAEQVCVALYGKPTGMDKESRARQAAQGLPTREVSSASKVSKANRQATSNSAESLTPSDKRHKAYLERHFNEGKEMTVEEFLKYKR